MKKSTLVTAAAIVASLGLYYVLKGKGSSADEDKPTSDFIAILNPEQGTNIVGGSVITVEWSTNLPDVSVFYHIEGDDTEFWKWVGSSTVGLIEFTVPLQVGKKLTFWLSGGWNAEDSTWAAISTVDTFIV